MKGLRWTVVGLMCVGCAQPTGSSPGGGGGAGAPASGVEASASSALVLFHADNGLYALKAADLPRERLKVVVDDFYPSVCFTRDVDEDDVPDSVDDDCHAKSDADADAGTRSDEDSDAEHERQHGCETCNRGPGTQGDFRFEVDGTQARLDRGRVLTRNAGVLEIPGPQGTVTVVLGADTEVRDGQPTPGSEIRVEGKLDGPAANRRILATQVKVLCQGPAPLPPGQVPPEAKPVPPSGGTPTDGGIN